MSNGSPLPVSSDSTRLVAESAQRFGLHGQSRAHRELLERIGKIAGVDVEVLITGPTGVGKELYARFLHECSPRRQRSFVAINCGAVPDHLFENELFGHQAGAYTGAQQAAEGLVAAAEGGTLFLDEVGDLTPTAQVKLLRLLQEKEYRRLGETRMRRVDVRFIAATNCNLQDKIRCQAFRLDLFQRLQVVPIQVPPLHERPDDIGVLLLAFVERYATQYGLPPITLSQRTWEHLVAYHWPGNIRELENCVRCLTAQQFDRPIDPEDLPLTPHATANGTQNGSAILNETFQTAKRQAVERFERQYLALALQRAAGNISEAARLAGKHRRAFFELLRKYHFEPDAYKSFDNGAS